MAGGAPMSVHAHEPRPAFDSFTLGRSPGNPMARASCGGSTTGDYPCQSRASWLMPDAPYCMQHMPVELISIARERARLWHEYATTVWAWVLDEVPLP